MNERHLRLDRRQADALRLHRVDAPRQSLNLSIGKRNSGNLVFAIGAVQLRKITIYGGFDSRDTARQSICVKFFSRRLTALNLLPSIRDGSTIEKVEIASLIGKRKIFRC